MLTLAIACTAALAGTTTVFAAQLVAGTVMRVPDNPLFGTPACEPIVAQQQALGSTLYPDSEVEPYLAADPGHPTHLIGAVQQDRWNDGGADGATSVYSMDGGVTWHAAAKQPAFTLCEGAAPGAPGGLNRSSDPWVSFGPDGTAYQVSLSFNANGPGFGGVSGVVASTSTDGGITWGPTRQVELDPSFSVLNDKESVTADPSHAGTAYVVWDRLISPSTHANPTATLHTPAFRGPAMFSRTTDFGQTWSTPQVLFDPGQNDQTIGNQIVVEPDGTLVDGTLVLLNKGGRGHNGRSIVDVVVMRSTDGGSTWTGPTVVSPLLDAPVVIAGHLVRTGDILPEFAIGPTGTLYATWQDGSFSPNGVAHVAFSQSTDGGVSWSPPVQIDQSPTGVPAFTPVVHAAADGTVAVTYYDLESATATSPGLTDEFIVHCHAPTADCASASSWAANGETKLDTSGAFDMTTAPDAGGYFTGDYEGLASTGTTFDALFVMARPSATTGPTDQFFNTAH